MKSSKKKYLILTIIILFVIVASVIGIYYYKKSNRLTINERNWLDEQTKSSQVVNIGVISNSYVFGKNGSGVLYDFLNDFQNEYSLNINKVTYEYGANPSGVYLGLKNTITENDTVIYEDHYVLISKDFENISSESDLYGKTVGVLASDLSYISSVVTSSNITFKTYETYEALTKNSEVNYMVVPLHLYLGDILENNYEIIYHFSDVNMYYTLSTTDDVLSSIIKKYYDSWKENFKSVYNDNLFLTMTDKMDISDTEIDAMQSVSYRYGFINNSPYEIISSGNYGGIISVYLSGFMDFADIDFTFEKYRNFSKFIKAINNKDIDLYFGYYNTDTDYSTTKSGIHAKYYVIANTKNDVVINSINSLKGKEVYVDENSYLYTYLTSINGINVKSYHNTKGLLKLNKKDTIILIDSNIYDYYHNHGLDNYTVRYENDLNYIYSFKSSNSSALYRLLDKYVSILDSNRVLNEGFYNHEKTASSGIILSYIAKYFIYILVLAIAVFLVLFKKTKKIKIAKKIKKEDKMKFIDQLTLLKNRNYLKENIASWSKNTIYPQAILVVDLNKLRKINDVEGYNEGDKQIKAAANALIKTQLDNSDIIRTDGNEFVVYMVGYSQKQVTNYIHKLNKEFNKLPYNYGAEFGYSMILDDIKTIEDALNEATTSLKEQKKGIDEKKN